MKKLWGKKAAIIGIIAIVIGSIAIFSAAKAINTHDTIVSADNYSESEIADGQIYELNDLVVFNEFSKSAYASGGKTKHYYVVGKYDRSCDNWVLYSLCLDKENELYQKLDAYVQNPDALVGDLKVSLCARAGRYIMEDQEIRGYYIVAADEFNKAAFSREAVVCDDYNFTYCFDSASNLSAYNSHNSLMLWMIVIPAAALIVCGLVVAYKNLRRITRGEI